VGITTMVIIAVVVLLLLISIRVPVAFALLAAGMLGLIMMRNSGYAFTTTVRTAYSIPGRYILIVIPLFIAMGIFAKHGSLAINGFAIASRVMRRIPGGLALATVATCAAFAAVSGSSVATVATIGPLAIREMRRYGYSPAFAAGVVGASGTLGVLIPPSVVLVLYGVVTGESIGRLLIAGIIPGILSAIVYAVAIVARGTLRPELVGAIKRSEELDELPDDPSRLRSLADTPVITPGLIISSSARVLTLFLIVVGGIYSGIVTATESAALGASAAFLFFIYDVLKDRRPFFRTFWSTIVETVNLSSMAFLLLIGAGVFTFFLVLAQVPASITNSIISLNVPGPVVILLLLLIFIPLGMVLDPLSMMLVGVPLAYPVVTGLGYDGIWFGILVVKLIEVGLVTPPFGMNAFVVAGSSDDVTLEETFRGVLWFVPVDLLTVVLLFLFPSIVLWLPNLMRG
jgi:C4-dicarboxylate transporter DctM subunit